MFPSTCILYYEEQIFPMTEGSARLQRCCVSDSSIHESQAWRPTHNAVYTRLTVVMIQSEYRNIYHLRHPKSQKHKVSFVHTV